MRNVLRKGNFAPFLKSNAPSGLALKVSHGNGHVATERLEPFGLLHHHGMAQVHLTAWHQAGQHTKRVAGTMSFQHLIDITMSEDNATTMEFRGFG